MSIHLGLLIGYSILLTAVGLWIGRFVRGSGDFFVAGRTLGAPLLFSTVLAANIGAGTTVGAAGMAYRDGLSAWWWNGTAGLASFVLAFWVGPRIWRLASAHGFYTAGDFLEHRYGQQVRVVIAALVWIGTLFILAGQLIAGAAVLEVVAGIPRGAGAAIGAVVMTIYFVAGGLLSSAWVNLLQLVVLMIGFALAVPPVLSAVGGLSGLASSAALPPGFLDPFYTSPATSVSGWKLLAIYGPAFMLSPGLLQKAYGARDEAAVKIGIAAQGACLLVFSFIPVFFGMAARVLHPSVASINLVLPTVFAEDMAPWLGALGLAAVFSAEVSTCDAILFMLSTSLSKDLYKRIINPAASDAQMLRVARIAAVAGGAIGTVLAVQLSTIVSALAIFYSLAGVSLFVPVIAGLAGKRGGAPEALAAIAAGIATLLAVQVATGGIGYGIFNPNLLGLIASAIAYAIVYVARGRGAGVEAV
ncbi:MAG TPA: sodium:solute symporter family protein [Vicinamibacterales bacterium]|nr:sodium:solute symporter family protein [Vicinamibacterales bacterium]